MTKIVKNIIEKALEKGYANKNGRMHLPYYIAELESQYQARYNKDSGTLEFDHWGTMILKIDNVYSDKPIIEHIYGQSKSDRDSIETIFMYFGLPYRVSYRPSTGVLSVLGNFGNGSIEEREF